MGHNKSQLPHLLVNSTKITDRYTTPITGGSTGLSLPTRDRQEHAQKLISQLEALKPIEKKLAEERKDLDLETSGLLVEFISDPALDLKLESLEFQRGGIELCSSHLNNDDTTTAAVFIPEGKIDFFLKKIIAYRDEETEPNKAGITKPKNQELVDGISNIKLAILDSLWTDDIELLPENQNDTIWWEVWLRLSDKSDNLGYFKEHAQRLGFRVNQRDVRFIDRAVILAYGTKANMARSISLLGIIAELRSAKQAGSFFTGMDASSQNDWVEDATKFIQVSPEINTYACLLDTGINESHPLLEPLADSADMHSYEPAWGTHDGYQTGHGTPMAGLVAYGDLTELLQTTHPVEIKHRLESVKILPNSGSGQNDPELYGAITRESISRVEVQPDRKRVFCMAVTADDHRGRGKPSSWSATVDGISSGAEDDEQRLIIISAGDTNPADHKHYPESNLTDTVQDPGQAWNALVVGGYTEKIHITDPDFSTYEPLACGGDLSPSSCTSATWGKNWPFKPDIVMEAGNVGIDRDINFTSFIDDLELLSTHHEFQNKPLVNFGETSAATALATRLATTLLAEYPEFWPETLRGLLVHSAEWTEAMKSRFPLNTKEGYRPLLQFCGYGVPNPSKLFWSTNNSLTLIVQDSLQPFFKDGSDIKTRDVNFHEIPWPQEILEGLGETKVEMKVTLSYFIEPNPGQRGWGTKYRYASHRLQFDVRRSLETIDSFKQRINKQARDEEFNSKNNAKETGQWILGGNLRKTGSIHSDTWTGKAVELAPRKYIAVYPLNGWWKELKKHERWGNQARYSLIISITTPETDIYTEVANQIQTLVEI